MERVSLLVGVKMIFRSYCLRILPVEKLDLNEYGKIILILEGEEERDEHEERGNWNLNKAVSMMVAL